MRAIKMPVMTAALAVILTAASPASAQQAQVQQAQAQQAQAVADPSAAPVAGFDAAAVVDADDLRSIAGREDVGALVAQADQRNVVSNNSVTGNSVTGAVTIDGNAFQNLQGMAVISANSGNNVAMNAAMNVTINMAPR